MIQKKEKDLDSIYIIKYKWSKQKRSMQRAINDRKYKSYKWSKIKEYISIKENLQESNIKICKE